MAAMAAPTWSMSFPTNTGRKLGAEQSGAMAPDDLIPAAGLVDSTVIARTLGL